LLKREGLSPMILLWLSAFCFVFGLPSNNFQTLTDSPLILEMICIIVLWKMAQKRNSITIYYI